MEAAGCKFDTARCLRGAARAAEDAQELLSRWEAVAPGVNPESPVQLSLLLYTTKGFPIPPISGTLKAVKRTKRDEKPTSEAALDWLLKKAKNPENKELLSVLMALRRTTKLAQFLGKLPGFVSETGFLFAGFGPDTGTGRLASRNPNLQNIPGAKNDKYGLRSCFIAPEGHQLLVADYSALEPRILGHFLVAEFGDTSLVDAIAAGDVYSAIAKTTWPRLLAGVLPTELKAHPTLGKYRDYAKIILLGTNYGKQVPGLALQLGVPLEEAQVLYDDYFRAYPGIAKFQALALERARETGGATTLLGRTRPIEGARSDKPWEVGRAQRQAVNTTIQGSAADIVFGAMIKQGRRCPGAVLQMQIHDELVWRVPVGADTSSLLTAMREPFKVPLLVPLEVEYKVLSNWGAMK